MISSLKLLSLWRTRIQRSWAWGGRRLSPYRRALLPTGVGVTLLLLLWGGYASWNLWRERRATLALSQIQASLKSSQSILTGGLPITRDTAAALEKAAADYLSIAERYRGTAGAEQALLTRGNLLMVLGRTEEALATYTRYIERYPRGHLTVLAYISLGYTLESLGKTEEAHQAYSQGLRQAGESNPLGAEAALGVARTLRAQKRREEANQVLQNIISRYPDSFWAVTARFSLTQR